MNGTKPKFLKKSALNPEYFKKPNPYMNAPSCHVNLLELSRYAKNIEKNLSILHRMKLKSFQFSRKSPKKEPVSRFLFSSSLHTISIQIYR